MPITLKLTDAQINTIALKRGWTAKIIQRTPQEDIETDNPITAKEYVINRYFDPLFREFAEVRKENEITTLEAEKRDRDSSIVTIKNTEIQLVKSAILS